MRKYQKSSIDEFFPEDKDILEEGNSVASAKECTGLAQSPVAGESMQESLQSIYDVPLAITDTQENKAANSDIQYRDVQNSNAEYRDVQYGAAQNRNAQNGEALNNVPLEEHLPKEEYAKALRTKRPL